MSQPYSHIINLSTHLFGWYSLGFLCFFTTSIAFCIFFYHKPNIKLENSVYWILTCLLAAFSAMRSSGIARDDLSYLEISKNICAISECFQLIQSSRDWVWYFLVSALKSFMPGQRAVLLLSGVGVFIQLLIIYKLCRQKLLSLILFIPLVYLYYDFTLLRAGLALTVFFIAFYFLVHSRKVLGSSILLGNYFFHSQGIFSIGIIPFHKIAKHKYIAIATMITLIACIYLQWTPSFEQISLLGKNESAHYWSQYQSGLFDNEKKIPFAHLLTIGCVILILLTNKSFRADNPIEQYAIASIFLAVFLAWLFAPIHAIQTRLFDFYLAPLVFLVGNLRSCRVNLIAALGLSTALYIRMELLHNWIIG